MTSTGETETTGTGNTPSPGQPAWQKSLKRYGPIGAVAVLILGAVLVFGGGGGDCQGKALRRISSQAAGKSNLVRLRIVCNHL